MNPFHAQDLLLDHCVAADRTDRSQDWNLMGVVLWVDVFARSFTAVVPLSVNFVERSNRPNSFSFKHVFSFFFRLLVESGRWQLNCFSTWIWSVNVQGSLNYSSWVIKQCKHMVVLRDYPEIEHCLGW